MKLVNNLIFALTTLTLGLVACTSELEHTTPDAEVSSQKVHIVVGASRENQGIQSRTELTENQGSLDCQWSDGDKILVTDESGKLKGILDLKEFKNEKKDYAYFEGDLRGVSSGKVTFNYYYVGTKLSASEEELKKLESPYTHDFSVQDGLFSSLTDYDLLSAQANTIIADGKSYVDIYLQRRISAAHFTLNNLPDNFRGDVQISGAGIRNEVSLPFTQHEAKTSANPDPCTITLQNVGKDFYMILLPNDVSEGFEMTFSTTFNGTRYEGKYRVSKAIGAAKYYRKALGDGTYGGLPVEMQEAKQYRVFYHINITDIDESDIDGVRKCTSLPDIVSGAEAASYRVRNFTEPILDTSEEIRNEADFTDGYLYEFLGWGTEESAKESWASDNLGVEYEAKENESDSEPKENKSINLTELATKENSENGVTYHDLHLYAKGSVMQYKLKVKGASPYSDYESGAGKYRMTGWAMIKVRELKKDEKLPYKPKEPESVFKGWSRMSGEVYIDKDKTYWPGDYVTISKEDAYGEWNPDYRGSDTKGRPVKGLQTLTLHIVWDEIPPVSLPGYDGGTLE